MYLEWKNDILSFKEKTTEQKRLKDKLEELLSQNVEEWKQERDGILKLCDQKKGVLRQIQRHADEIEREEKRERENLINFNEEVVGKERTLTVNIEFEETLSQILSERKGSRYDLMRGEFLGKISRTEEKRQQEMNRLVELRAAYLRVYQNRNFSPTTEDNTDYQELLNHLNDERLEEFRVRAAEQARTAVEHFKDDFMYKIRSAIKEAVQRKDELNRIISRLDFGKDNFISEKIKGQMGSIMTCLWMSL